MSCVNTEPPRPKGESLASAIAAALSGHPEEQRDRAEELLVVHGVVLAHMGQDVRLHEAAGLATRRLAAHEGPCPVRHGLVDLCNQRLQCPLR